MVRILLVDDHKAIRDGLKLYFEDQDEFVVVAEASNGVEALDVLEKQTIDLVITDISMPRMDGVELMKQVIQHFPEQRVIALTMMGESQFVSKMISLGVHGYLLKNVQRETFLDAVRKVSVGENFFSQDATTSIKMALADRRKPEGANTQLTLSNSDKELLRLIMSEYTTQEAATKLGVSEESIENQREEMVQRSGCKNMAELVMRAIEVNLI